MFADETMRQVLGVDKPLSPEACYQHWFDRIKDGYQQYVEQSVEKMVTRGRVVQLEYPWEHPKLGEVIVRCTGVRTEDADGLVCLEGYHRIISDVECSGYLPDVTAGEVFVFSSRTGRIYFHTPRRLLAGEQTYEEHFPQCWLDGEMVHPHFAKRFAKLFEDVAGSQDVSGQEILLRSKNGTYEWFKLSTRHSGIDQGEPGAVTVRLDTVDPERILELENMRIRDFYHASLAEAIAYAEVDLESNQIRAAGGVWAGYENYTLDRQEEILEFMLRQAGDQVRAREQLPQDHEEEQEVFPRKPDTQRFRYQRLLNGHWIWVELVVHTFQERFTDNTYALLYLKDIDSQTRRELAHRDAARRDPLTRVYNRTTFRSEVEAYIQEESDRTGVLILLDVDNFKEINDRFGHLEGDRVLKRVTALLQSTFRCGDLVGRLGGDEFMVFVKGTIRQEALEQRMQAFLSNLYEAGQESITCSAGITLVQNENFVFEQSVCQADMALYKSKKMGKNHFCYYTDVLEKEMSAPV